MTKRIRGHSGTMSIVFISSANFYRRFIQGFSRIATSLTAMLKTTGSSVASAFRVDDDEIGSVGAGAEGGGSVVKPKVPQSLLQKSSSSMPTSHSLWTWLPDSPSILRSMIVLSSWSMLTSS